MKIYTEYLDYKLNQLGQNEKIAKIAGILKPFLFFFVIAFLEMELKIATHGTISATTILYILSCSMIYGEILFLLTTFVKNEKVNFIVRSIVMFLFIWVYCAVYLSQCEFQMFYDVPTMVAGALDAFGSFTGDIIILITGLSGAGFIFIALIPLILYLKYARQTKMMGRASVKQRVFVVIIIVCLTFVNGMTSYMNKNIHNIYATEYTYEAALDTFGLFTAVRLDIMAFVKDRHSEMSEEDFQIADTNGSGDYSFEGAGGENDEKTSVSGNDSASVSENDTEEAMDNQPKEYGYNVLDIDFNALAESSSGELAALDKYVASLEPSRKNEYTGLFEGKNLIFITAEAFTAEAVNRKTPTLYRMASKGICFTDYYQFAVAGTTGGEYNNIMGMYPTSGGSSMKKTATHLNYMTIGNQLNMLGYYGKVYHNNSYTYYDRHKTHVNLGYSEGYEGVGNGLEDVITKQWPESDLEMIQGTIDSYIIQPKFNIYYMTVSGHSLYTLAQNQMSKKHWDEAVNFNYNDKVKCYLAAQIELDKAMEYLIDRLEKAKKADNTVIVISADHFPYGLDQDNGSYANLSNLYGKKISDNFVRDHNQLIIWSGCLEDKHIQVDDPVSSIDVLPTLLNLFGVDYDSRLLPGRDVFSDSEPFIFSPGYEWKTNLGTFVNGRFVPKHDGIELPENYINDHKVLAQNKMKYCKGVLNNDYFRHVFGEK